MQIIDGHNETTNASLRLYKYHDTIVTLLVSIIAAGSSSLVSGCSPITTIVGDCVMLAACLCFEPAPKRLSILTCKIRGRVPEEE